MDNYTLVPHIAHRDPVIKLGKTFDKIRDNMVSFLREDFDWPEDYGEERMTICYRIRDHHYNSIEELVEDIEKVCNGYVLVKG